MIRSWSVIGLFKLTNRWSVISPVELLLGWYHVVWPRHKHFIVCFGNATISLQYSFPECVVLHLLYWHPRTPWLFGLSQWEYILQPLSQTFGEQNKTSTALSSNTGIYAQALFKANPSSCIWLTTAAFFTSNLVFYSGWALSFSLYTRILTVLSPFSLLISFPSAHSQTTSPSPTIKQAAISGFLMPSFEVTSFSKWLWWTAELTNLLAGLRPIAAQEGGYRPARS